jgi:hypothetical protein
LELHRGGGRSRTSGSPGLQEFDPWVYFDTQPSGTTTADQPSYPAQGGQNVVAVTLPFAADYAIHVRDGNTAVIRQWNGSAWNQAYRYRRPRGGARYQLLFPLVRVNFELGVIMVIAVSCVKLLSAHNSTQHTSRKHKV